MQPEGAVGLLVKREDVLLESCGQVPWEDASFHMVFDRRELVAHHDDRVDHSRFGGRLSCVNVTCHFAI